MFLDIDTRQGSMGAYLADERMSLPPRAAEAVEGRAPHGITRVLDVVLAGLSLALVAPLLLLIACAVRIDSHGPALFVHRRIGRFGRAFPCLKFRTMVVDADRVLIEHLAHSPDARAEWERDHKLRRDPRITRLGRFLRRSSLDELPQLFNILIGQMSVVGPRPIVEAEIVRYGAHFADYCSVRPGLTGPWQISGRNDVSYDERVLLDSRYAHAKSLLGDLAIICRTVPSVLLASGSY